jgi:hypothetical protein
VRRGESARVAEGLGQRGLAAPARLLLEAHRPLRPLMTEASVFVGPLLRPLLGTRFDGWLRVLEDDDEYDALIEALDDAEHR